MEILYQMSHNPTSSLSSNIICDQTDENKEAAHASPQTNENSAEQSGT